MSSDKETPTFDFEGFQNNPQVTRMDTSTSESNPGTPNKKQKLHSSRQNMRSSTARQSLQTSSMSATHLTPQDPGFDESTEAKKCILCYEVNPHKTRHMAKCDSCGYWCHVSCARTSARNVELTHNWHCPKCIDPENPEALNPRSDNDGVPQDIAGALFQMKKTVKTYKIVPKSMRAKLAGLPAE